MIGEEAWKASPQSTRVPHPRWTCEGLKQEQGGERYLLKGVHMGSRPAHPAQGHRCNGVGSVTRLHVSTIQARERAGPQ